jgi:hypothetical protein
MGKMIGAGGGNRARLLAGSMPNKGCIFGSMAGMPPTVGVPASIVSVYQRETNYCNFCIPVGCKAGFAYMKANGLIFSSKSSSGGTGRMHSSPGIGRLYGRGNQTFV